MGVTSNNARGRLVINTEKPPRLPVGFSIVEPQKTYGTIIWNPDEVELYQNLGGQPHQPVTWVYEQVKHLQILPAVVLDALLEQPSAWPKAWRPKRAGKELNVLFLGTLYVDEPHKACRWVRFGYWDNGYLEEGMTAIERSHCGHDSYVALLV